jgi:D-galactarolactone cycloisomerase
LKIASVEFVPLSLPLAAPFHPAWFPDVTQTTADGTLIKVHADEGGITGYGWQNSFGSEVKIVGESQVFRDLVYGNDLFSVEKIIRILSGITYSMNTVDLWGVELAIWDAIGKASHQPVYKLLGGAQDRVMAYASTGMIKSPEEQARDAVKYLEMGFRAIKVRIHSDDLEKDLGPIRAIRDAVSSQMKIMVDANQAATFSGPVWSYRRALETARALEKLDVFWLEEPLYHAAHEDLARLTEEADIQIAGGEDENGFFRFKELIEQNCFDIIQADVCASGGILQLNKIATLAQAAGKFFIPHSFDMGINLAGALQVIGSVPNAPFVEYGIDLPAIYAGHDPLMKKPIDVTKDGYVRIPDGPGLGIEIDEEYAEKHRV